MEGGILWTILIGFVVGLLAKFLHPGKESMGLIMTTLLGIGGSLLATYAGQFVGWYKVGQVSGFIASVVGAILLLVIYGLVKGKAGG